MLVKGSRSSPTDLSDEIGCTIIESKGLRDGLKESLFWHIDRFDSIDYLGWPRRRLHSPRAERMKVKPPSAPSAQSVQTKKKPPVDLAISP